MWAIPGHNWAQIRPALAKSIDLQTDGRIWPKLSRSWATSTCRLNLAQIGHTWSSLAGVSGGIPPRLGQSWPDVGEVCAAMAESNRG